ncbi:MAG: aminotransferase class III-fold pyridoxal phosphate-dependent enzyme [Pirellulales bacterium]
MTNPSPITRSQELYQRAQQLVPGGTQLLSRRPHIFAPGVAPIFADRAQGARIWDVDGGEYLDYGMSVSACILGYADPVVNDAVRAQLDRGVMYSLNHPAELELAELLCQTIPCAEMVRYAKGGGEACAIAVRIARGVTGKDKVLFCGYHGWHDWYLAANLDATALDAHLFPGIEPLGVPRGLAGTAIPFPYGDLAALAQAIDQHAADLACVIMEPMRSTPAPPDYLAGVRELTAQRGVILVFDEVTTGFRHAPGGVEEFLGVTPDMATFAKSLSNGFAMGAVVGRRAVMEPAARMFISSTNWSDLVGIVAATATLREIRRRRVPERLAEYGQRLMAGWNSVAREVGIPAIMHGTSQWPLIEFSVPESPDSASASAVRRDALLGAAPTLGRQLAALYAQEMARHHVLFNTHPVHSAAHLDRDLDETLTATRAALTHVRDTWHAGRVADSLAGSLAPPVFRRLVQ